ncbi:alanine/ornithine racemase family PLP-dependent enzyme [Leucobacter sp. NPDC058333]|uniref:alanine/ornithine racemase family PLP-dependent enzyme n=1 Tax=Leucobacter sp. NPDC058333 TaxID=3346450 RepID=UPI00364BA2B8
MSAPRLEIDLDAIEWNTRTLVERLSGLGVRVLGVAKGACGLPEVAQAIVRGGATGIGDSRVDNLARLRESGVMATCTLIRSPMLSQVKRAIQIAEFSVNTEPSILRALAREAEHAGQVHGVILMVEMGDLREGIAAGELIDAAQSVTALRGLKLDGIGTNLACHSGIVPDEQKMSELSDLAVRVERQIGHPLATVSGGNSANLNWAFRGGDVGRVNELRLGEAILLGTEPLTGGPVSGLRTDAFKLVGEVIEVRDKPVRPWGTYVAMKFGDRTPPIGTGTIRQAIVALGRLDTVTDGLTPPQGMTILGMSSDHLILNIGHHTTAVGDEIFFDLGYSALMRATSSPYVEAAIRGGSSHPANHPGSNSGPQTLKSVA